VHCNWPAKPDHSVTIHCPWSSGSPGAGDPTRALISVGRSGQAVGSGASFVVCPCIADGVGPGSVQSGWCDDGRGYPGVARHQAERALPACCATRRVGRGTPRPAGTPCHKERPTCQAAIGEPHHPSRPIAGLGCFVSARSGVAERTAPHCRRGCRGGRRRRGRSSPAREQPEPAASTPPQRSASTGSREARPPTPPPSRAPFTTLRGLPDPAPGSPPWPPSHARLGFAGSTKPRALPSGQHRQT
jgi:hypothetical protein